MLDRLRAVDGVSSLGVEAREQAQVILIQSSRGSELVQSLMRELDGANVGRVVSREPTLEHAYVELVGRA
jgi:ABC-2 type transport system ATP-binding protein